MPDWLIEIVPVTPTEPGGPHRSISSPQLRTPGRRQHHMDEPDGRTARDGTRQSEPAVMDRQLRRGFRPARPVVESDVFGRGAGQLDENGQPRRTRTANHPRLRPRHVPLQDPPDEIATFNIIKVPPTF